MQEAFDGQKGTGIERHLRAWWPSVGKKDTPPKLVSRVPVDVGEMEARRSILCGSEKGEASVSSISHTPCFVVVVFLFVCLFLPETATSEGARGTKAGPFALYGAWDGPEGADPPAAIRGDGRSVPSRGGRGGRRRLWRWRPGRPRQPGARSWTGWSGSRADGGLWGCSPLTVRLCTAIPAPRAAFQTASASASSEQPLAPGKSGPCQL